MGLRSSLKSSSWLIAIVLEVTPPSGGSGGKWSGYFFLQHGNHTKQGSFWWYLVKPRKRPAPEMHQEARGMYAWLQA